MGFHQISPVAATSEGLYAVHLWPGHVADLVHAVDPSGGVVVVEDQLITKPGQWTAANTILGEPWTRLGDDTMVSHVRASIRMPPSTFVEFGPSIPGVAVAGLEFWQSTRTPPAQTSLGNKAGPARRNAFVGLDVLAFVTIPHEGEVSVITAPTAGRVEAAVERIKTARRSK